MNAAPIPMYLNTIRSKDELRTKIKDQVEAYEASKKGGKAAP